MPQLNGHGWKWVLGAWNIRWEIYDPTQALPGFLDAVICRISGGIPMYEQVSG
jgi:hypothetical protein